MFIMVYLHTNATEPIILLHIDAMSMSADTNTIYKPETYDDDDDDYNHVSLNLAEKFLRKSLSLSISLTLT